MRGSRYERPQEDEFVAIAKDEPSFGGFFVGPNGELVVYSADSSRVPQVNAAVQRRIALDGLHLPRRLAEAPVVVKVGRFTFQQLSDYRDSISDAVLGRVAGAVYDDLDESRNQVTIGLIPSLASDARGQLDALLHALGIPANAIHIVGAGEVIPTVSGPLSRRAPAVKSRPLNLLNLQSAPADTLGGGEQIGMKWPDGEAKNCTLGFVAMLSGTRVFVTASHCSSTKWGLDATQFYSINAPGGGSYNNLLGSESVDPGPGTCPIGWQCSTYRYSDADLVDLSSSSLPSRVGLIARPSGRATGTYGPLMIDPTHRWFVISNVQTSYAQYQTLEKVGRTTGWTYGQVTATCVDSYEGGLWGGRLTRCAGKAAIFVDEGDSGAPVFSWDGQDGAGLYGIEFAAEGQSVPANSMFFSPMQNAFNELGALQTVNSDISVGTPTLTGAFDVNSGAPLVSWTAVATANGLENAAPPNYQIFRQMYDYQNPFYSQITQEVYSTSSAPGSFPDTDFGGSWAPYEYSGTTPPPPNTSYISYYVRTYYSGIGHNSATVYYLFCDPTALGC